MEAPKHREFPDLEDGIYVFKGGYIVIEGNAVKRLPFPEYNLEILIMNMYRDHPRVRFRGLLPEKHLQTLRIETSRLKRQQLGITDSMRKDIGRSIDPK